MKSVAAGVVFILFGLLILFQGYSAGDARQENSENKTGPDAVDLMVGFFMLGLGAYCLF